VVLVAFVKVTHIVKVPLLFVFVVEFRLVESEIPALVLFTKLVVLLFVATRMIDSVLLVVVVLFVLTR